MRLLKLLLGGLLVATLLAACDPPKVTGGKAPMPPASQMNQSVAVNTAKPGDECDPKRETCWRAANVQPYGNRSVERAIHLLVQRAPVSTDAKRAHITANLLAKVRAGPSYVDDIPSNFRSTVMVFGDGVVLSNVVSVTKSWQPHQSRKADWYEFRDADGTIYVLFRPHICSNWSLRIITPQGYCVYDEVLCEGECLRLRMQVMGLLN